MAYSLTYSYDSTSQSYSVTGYSNISTSDRVVIPDTYDDGTNGKHPVISVGDSAFNTCSNLTSVMIGNSVTSIGYEAFWDCSKLTSVTIGNSVTSISAVAFRGCSSLTSIIIPDSVTSIDISAFYLCDKLTQLILFPSTPPDLGSGAIPDNVQLIYVRQSSKAAYQAAMNWTAFATEPNNKIVSDNIYLSFVRFNQKNKEYISEKISENISELGGNALKVTIW